MPKIKPPRKNILTDMTAMTDVAFLLLTFFILTTEFKPEEAVVVDVPWSVSDITVPDNNMVVVTLNPDGKVFFGMDGQHNRIAALEKMGLAYDIEFTEGEKRQFALVESFGVPVAQMKQFLNRHPAERKKMEQPGIPVDSTMYSGNELHQWLVAARQSNKQYRIALKGDRDASYKSTSAVIRTFQNQKINKFNFITNLEALPEGAVAGLNN